MTKIQPFEEYSQKYEDWFEANQYVYLSELEAIRNLLPTEGTGLEVGVGSGRFAEALGVKFGVEPSENMRALAHKRGIDVVDGVAEKLPFGNEQFDFVLMVTTICFVDNIETSFREAYRVLRPNGLIIIGFINRESSIGRIYQQYKEENLFYKDATFYSTDEVILHLSNAGFGNFKFVQTIFRPLEQIKEMEPIKEGYNEGSFIGLRARK